MNTEETSENIFTYCILNNEFQLKTLHQRLGWKYFKKTLQDQDGKELFRKTKKVFIKNIKSPSHLLPCKLPCQFISRTSTKTKITNCINVFIVLTIVETAMEVLPLLMIYLFNYRRLDLACKRVKYFILSVLFKSSALSALFCFCCYFLADIWYNL